MFDYIHDIASGYRILVEAISYPGTIYNVGNLAKKNSLNISCFDGVLLFAFMLLDQEVTFHIVGICHKEVSEQMARLTYSKTADIDSANFIFILKDATEAERNEAISRASIGTLVDPHLGATVILELPDIEGMNQYYFGGPGIEFEKEVKFSGFPEWDTIRRDKNKEFPLGIDMIFIDQKGMLLALPRTTIVKGREE